MRKDTEGHLFILVVIRRVVVTNQIDDGCGGNRRFEKQRLGNQPCAKLSAITNTFDSKAAAVDPQIAAHCSADSVHDVLRLVTVLITEHCICKCLAVSC